MNVFSPNVQEKKKKMHTMKWIALAVWSFLFCFTGFVHSVNLKTFDTLNTVLLFVEVDLFKCLFVVNHPFIPNSQNIDVFFFIY